MRVIKHLCEQIEEEVDGVIEYAKDALEYKHVKPQLAEVYYKLSNTEHSHVTMLHEQVVKMVEEAKRDSKEPPAFMLEKWEKFHKEIIAKMAEAKTYLSLYK